jgi:NAD(P)H dehydrogenase (quinone)
MMKAHIVFAHPNLHSYNGQLRNTAIETLEAQGWRVSVSDLYQMKFKAAADEDDFTALYNTDFFDLQTEQQVATQRKTYSADIQREHQLLAEADLIIFQFPLWWYSMPALMKGYIDRVFSMGWAYGGGQALAGKKVLVSMTTGAPDFAWTEEKRGTIKEIFKHLFVGTFGLCGLRPLEPFIVYGAKRQSEQEKILLFERYKTRLVELVK